MAVKTTRMITPALTKKGRKEPTSYETKLHHRLRSYKTPTPLRATVRVVASAAWRLANMEQMVPREEMLRGQRPARPPGRRLGVFLGEDALVLTGVSQDGLAGKAGMQEGDRLVSIGGVELADRAALGPALRAEGERKLIVWMRGETRMSAWFDWEKNAVEKVPAADTADAPGGSRR